jgi:1-phosphatidylinositol-4-phosphate 5-kinase
LLRLQDGRRDGIGIKTYEDGSMYDGFWQDGKKHGLGAYRPPPPEDASRRQSLAAWQTPPAAAAAAAQQQQAGGGGPEAGTAAAAGAALPQSPRGVTQEDGFEAAAALGPLAAGKLLAAEGMNHVPSMGNIMQLSQAQGPRGSRAPASPSRISATAGGIAAGDASAAAPPLSPRLAAQQEGGGEPAAPAQAPLPPLSEALAPLVAASSGGALGAPRLLIREYDKGSLLREDALSAEEIKMIFGFLWPKRQKKVRQRMRRALGRKGPRLQLKMGEVVYKGHYSYELMNQLQLGIRYSVGHTVARRPSVAAAPSSSGGGAAAGTPSPPPGSPGEEPPIAPADFAGKLKVFFPSCGSSTTPAHPCIDFKWKDYAPRVFRRLRAAAHIDEADYMISLGGSTALRQLNSPGKSGSVFFLSGGWAPAHGGGAGQGD